MEVCPKFALHLYFSKQLLCPNIWELYSFIDGLFGNAVSGCTVSNDRMISE
jgi:hypothetical protein